MINRLMGLTYPSLVASQRKIERVMNRRAERQVNSCWQRLSSADRIVSGINGSGLLGERRIAGQTRRGQEQGRGQDRREQFFHL